MAEGGNITGGTRAPSLAPGVKAPGAPSARAMASRYLSPGQREARQDYREYKQSQRKGYAFGRQPGPPGRRGVQVLPIQSNRQIEHQ